MAERPPFLAGACGGDAVLQREIEALLEHASQGSGFMSTPAVGVSVSSLGRGPSLVGRQLGRYTVQRRLGSGGMGEVYLAEDTQLRRPVAVKALHDEGIATPQGRQRLLREAQAVAALNHPNIAAIYDLIDVSGDAGTPPHIVMEYVAGETLSDRLKRGRIPFDEALRICKDVADALAATHQRGIIHRDLKPANLQIAEDGRVKVLDFGLARRVASSAETTNFTTERALLSRADHRIAGTPGYMSPEQALGRPVGTSTDVFSLGVVLYEMLAGYRPYAGDEFVPVSPEHVQPGVPPAVDRLVTRMLALGASDRPSAAEIVIELGRLMRPDGVDDARAAARRGRTWLSYEAAAAAVAVILAGVGAWWWTSRGPRTVSRPSIAIMSLANLTGDSAKDYVGVGIAEALTTSLARLSSVSVISTTNMADATRGADVGTIARDVGATMVLQGGVQQSGDRLRVNAKLMNPDGSVEWAGEAEAQASDLFQLETRLAEAVIAGLSVSVSAAERQTAAAPPTGNPQALEAYWQGLAFSDRRSPASARPASISLAIASFEKATALDPQFAAAFGALGESYRRHYEASGDTGAIAKATAAIARGLAIDPGRTEVRLSRAALYGQTGRAAEAAAELRTIIAQHPENDEAHRRLGTVLNEAGQAQDALREFQTAAMLRPAYWRNHQALGFFFYTQKRLPEAVAAFTRVIEIRPDDSNAYMQRGSALQELGDRARARADYEKSIALASNAAAYSNLGILAYDEKRYDDAADAFAAAIRLRPKRAIYHRNLGDTFLKLKRAEKARAEYLVAIALTQEALGVNPGDATALSQLAVYEAKVGRAAEARRHADQAGVYNPNNAEVLFRRGVTMALVGDTASAVAALQGAIDHGYSINQVRTDDDLAPLANVPAFRALVQNKPAR